MLGKLAIALPEDNTEEFGDHDLLVLDPFRDVRILKPEYFLQIFSKNNF